MASPSPGSRARGSAKDKQERRKTASAKRQMLALAEGMVQNAELPDDLSNRLSAPVTQLLRTGFVVDVSASAEEAPDLSAPKLPELSKKGAIDALGGLLEVPAYLLMPVLADKRRCGRPRAWALYVGLGALPLLILAVPEVRDASASIALALCARFWATGGSATAT